MNKMTTPGMQRNVKSLTRGILCRILIAAMGLIMLFHMTGCSMGEAGGDEEAGESAGKPLYEQGLVVVELINEKIHSEQYLSVYGSSDITASELMEKLKGRDLSEPDEIYEIVFSEETIEQLLKYLLEGEMKNMPVLLRNELKGKMLDSFINMVNSRMGAYAVATTGILKSSSLFTDENVKEQNIMYLYCYEDCYPMAVTFSFGENGAILASGGPCFLEFGFENEDELMEALFGDMHGDEENAIRIKRIKR